MSAFGDELTVTFCAGLSAVLIVTAEEERCLEEIVTVADELKRPVWVWDMGCFFAQANEVPGKAPGAGIKDPIAALEAIEKSSREPAIFVLRDFHQCWDRQAQIVRKLRTLSHDLRVGSPGRVIVVTSPLTTLPIELRNDFALLRMPRPDLDQMKGAVTEIAQVVGTPEAGLTERVAQAALGLTANEADRAVRTAVVQARAMTPGVVASVNTAKGEVVRGTAGLVFCDTKYTTGDVGALGMLKSWVRERSGAWKPEARKYGLPQPKGMLLLGVPGTGKSLVAQAIAGDWQFPLLRLDIGALFGSLVGESENNMRTALDIAERVAPCVLWVDEIEKGVSYGGGDGGTSARVVQGLLTWMQERKAPVFVIATANSLTTLPPELTRAGRFDVTFFIDLPAIDERKEIIGVLLGRHGRSANDFDVPAIAAASDEYSGAELEQAIVDGLYAAFDAGERALATADIVAALGHIVPIARSQQEMMASLRRWVSEGRARPASEDNDGHARAPGRIGFAAAPLTLPTVNA
jgi:hypothetical protein